MAFPFPPSTVLFSLLPRSTAAMEMVKYPENSRYLSFWQGLPVLNIRSIPSADSDPSTLATIGRAGDIVFNDISISRKQCSFQIDAKSGIVICCDTSKNQTTWLVQDPEGGPDQSVYPFQGERNRKVALVEGMNEVIAFGGPPRGPYMFKVIWHHNIDKTTEATYSRLAPQLSAMASAFQETQPPTIMDTLQSSTSTRIYPRIPAPPMRIHILGPGVSGSSGTVYKAVDVDKPRFLAVKCMRTPPTLTVPEVWYHAVKREIEILSGLKHPNIIEFLKFDQRRFPGGLELRTIMPWLDGSVVDLRASLNAEEVPLATERILYDILSALDYLCEKDIVHGDVKPDDILYRRNRFGDEKYPDPVTFVLCDFGSAFPTTHAASKPTGGTPLYMAPELILGLRPTHKSDVWALYVPLLWNTDPVYFERSDVNTTAGIQEVVSTMASGTMIWGEIKDMVNEDPEKRATAAQMLLYRYKGEKGLTTQERWIPRLGTW